MILSCKFLPSAASIKGGEGGESCTLSCYKATTPPFTLQMFHMIKCTIAVRCLHTWIHRSWEYGAADGFLFVCLFYLCGRMIGAAYIFRKKKQEFGAQVFIYFWISEINTESKVYVQCNFWLNVS